MSIPLSKEICNKIALEEVVVSTKSSIKMGQNGTKLTKIVHCAKKGKVIPNAKVIVEGINKPVTTTATGEYWRLLRPGQYKIKAQDNSGHYSDSQTISITSDSEVQIMDFTLDKGYSENQGAETCFVESKIILSCLLIQYVYPIFY